MTLPNNFATYQRCTRCSGHAQPGTKALAAYLEDRFPYQSSLGIYNCRTVAGKTYLSQHACGRAYDSGLATTSSGGPRLDLGLPIVELLASKGARLGITQLIYARRIYDKASPDGRYYGGTHPHNNHIHESQTYASGHELTYATLVDVLGPATPSGDTDMLGLNIGLLGEASLPYDPEVETLQRMLLDRGQTLPQWGPDGEAGDETRTAHAAWQGVVGVTDEAGLVGPQSYAALHKAGGQVSIQTKTVRVIESIDVSS